MTATSMRTFTINFLGEPVHQTPNLDHYRDSLLSSDQRLWYADGGGASFAAKTAAGVRCTLVFVSQRGHGLSLLANVPGSGAKKRVEFVSTSDALKINEFMRTLVAPVGSFVAPEHAWWAVEDYFKNPEALSAPELDEYCVAGLSRVLKNPRNLQRAPMNSGVEPLTRSSREISELDHASAADANWQKVKVDWQVVAIAKARGCDLIVSSDTDVLKLGQAAGIRCQKVDDLPIPEALRQLPIPLTKHGDKKSLDNFPARKNRSLGSCFSQTARIRSGVPRTASNGRGKTHARIFSNEFSKHRRISIHFQPSFLRRATKPRPTRPASSIVPALASGTAEAAFEVTLNCAPLTNNAQPG